MKLYAIKVDDFSAFDAALMDPKFNVRIDRGGNHQAEVNE